jgi:hypothetical protein
MLRRAAGMEHPAADAKRRGTDGQAMVMLRSGRGLHERIVVRATVGVN